jgi:hypothetical protein
MVILFVVVFFFFRVCNKDEPWQLSVLGLPLLVVVDLASLFLFCFVGVLSFWTWLEKKVPCFSQQTKQQLPRTFRRGEEEEERKTSVPKKTKNNNNHGDANGEENPCGESAWIRNECVQRISLLLLMEIFFFFLFFLFPFR